MENIEIHLTKFQGEYVGYRINYGKEKLLGKTIEEASSRLTELLGRMIMKHKIEYSLEEKPSIEIDIRELGLSKDIWQTFNPIKNALKSYTR
ncbi:MAG: hypothetical protein WC584_04260 [Candidatus Pacearchaeota archaeon]